MKIEEILHMMGGCGGTSYANNSKLQEKAIFETKPIVEGAIKEICNNLLPKTFVVADLGCSTGPNAILPISMITNFIDELYDNSSNEHKPEIQFFLNDLPSNDFNDLFQLSTLYSKRMNEEKGDKFVSFYITGLPGSFYGRLFPSKSVHFFHSNFCITWLSQVPKGLKEESCAHLTKRSMYINKESSSIVSYLYLEQFKRDFSIFLQNRSKELIFGGCMILSFLGKTNPPSIGGHTNVLGLLSEVLNDMVAEGLVDDAKLNDFKLPFYTPLMEEVEFIIEMEGSFHLIHAHTFKSNWDPFDESGDEFMVDNDMSGENVAKCLRAVFGPLLASHFGDEIMKDLFSRFAKKVARHMSKGKPKYTIFIIYLKLTADVINTSDAKNNVGIPKN